MPQSGSTKNQPHANTWGRKRLTEITEGLDEVPRVVETLRLGFLDEWAPGYVRKLWRPQTEILHEDGSMFGGMVAALADQILTFTTLSAVPDDKIFRTINLSVQFFRISRNEPLVIEAEVLAQTKRLISAEATFAWEDGTLIAKASAQQALLPMPGRP